MRIEKEQYDRLRALAKEIDTILDGIRGISPGGDSNEKYWNERMGILADVMLKGGIVSNDEWASIGKQHGYDRRGLGGYFVGKKASMVMIADDKRAITNSGKEEVLAWLDGRWDIKPTEEQQKKYKGLKGGKND